MKSKHHTPRFEVNMGHGEGSSPKPRLSKHDRKAEKQTARLLREAQQKSLSFHAKRLCLHSDWEYIQSRSSDFPFQREAEPAKETILALKNNHSYSQSGIIQSYGKVNLGDDMCSCCARIFALGRTRTWKGCVSFPVDLEYPGRPKGSVPFLGQCANCHWGSQGWKCSIRAGGLRIPPRRQRADLFQSSTFNHTHLGTKHNLDTTTGCDGARQELQGIMNQLSHRITRIQNNRRVDQIGDEMAQYNDDDDDDDGYVAPSNMSSTPHVAPTRQNHQAEKPAILPPGYQRKVASFDDEEEDDEDDYVSTTKSPSTFNSKRTRRSRQNGKPPAHRPSSRIALVKLEGDDDDDEYMGPANAQSSSIAISTRRTRRSSKAAASPSNSRVAVVIPPFRPLQTRRSTRKFSSPYFQN